MLVESGLLPLRTENRGSKPSVSILFPLSRSMAGPSCEIQLYPKTHMNGKSHDTFPDRSAIPTCLRLSAEVIITRVSVVGL
jgi:hypothetical protein